MNTDEIKVLIESTITGQGNQIDTGGKLADILKAIIDNIPETPIAPESVVFDFGSVPDSKEINKTDYDKAKGGLGIRCGGDVMPVLNALGQTEYEFFSGMFEYIMSAQPQEILFFGRVRYNTQGGAFSVNGNCYALAEVSGKYYVVNLPLS